MASEENLPPKLYIPPCHRPGAHLLYSHTVQPKFNDYQLLGDSIFVRFASNVLKQPYKYVDGANCLGYCVSGQRIKQLARRIKKNSYPILNKVLVLIGTNDVLAGKKLPWMTQDMLKLINILRARKVTNITILTLPPIPRLALTPSHWAIVRGFNTFLKAFDADDVHVLDILPLFTKLDCPLIAGPPAPPYSMVGVTYHFPSMTSLNGSGQKRKADVDMRSNSNDKLRKKLLLDPSLTEEDDSKLGDFGRYLNRKNREEMAEAAISSDEEAGPEYLAPAKVYIDYKFWKSLKDYIKDDDNEKFWPFASPSPAPLTSSSEPCSPTIPANPLTPSDESGSEIENLVNSLDDKQKQIIEKTGRFLRLNLYEMIMGGTINPRMDMIHPNKDGLEALNSHLLNNLNCDS